MSDEPRRLDDRRLDERRPNDERPADRLPEQIAHRVLDRASAIDADHASSVPVDVLRQAARDAGISAEAFDAALAEERGGTTLTPRVRKRRPLVLLSVFVANVLVFGGMLLFFRSSPSRRMPPLPRGSVEEAFTLECVTPSAAAERLRETIRERDAAMWFTSKEPRTLHVRVPARVMPRVRATIEAAEAQAPTCAVSPG